MRLKGSGTAETLGHGPDHGIGGLYDVESEAARFGPRQRDMLPKTFNDATKLVLRGAGEGTVQYDLAVHSHSIIN
jgi:hypothetical protein